MEQNKVEGVNDGTVGINQKGVLVFTTQCLEASADLTLVSAGCPWLPLRQGLHFSTLLEQNVQISREFVEIRQF